MFRTVVKLVVFIASLAGGFEVRAQVVLSDYESSARADQIRTAAGWRLAFRPPLSVLQQAVAQLRSAPGLAPAVLADVDTLVARAASEPEPVARATLWRAVTALYGRTWTAEQELFGALSLKTATPIWTGASTDLAIDALYAARGQKGVRYKVNLFRSEATGSATPKKGDMVRVLGSGTVSGKYPQRIPVSVAGVSDGAYLIVTEVSGPSGATTDLAQPVYVIADMQKRYAAFKTELAGIQGHDEAKWVAEYPYALAQAISEGKREVIAYDFPRALARSGQILAELRSGTDSVRQAKGLQNRAYRFDETGELIPYQIYVPSTWSASRTWPLVIAMHGANLDETNMLTRAGNRMQRLAEESGYIVVAPLGYRVNSAYGSQRGLGAGGLGGDDVRRARSEKDVLAVSALVEREYNVDPRRRYLTGNSMGGGGTWWIGGKYPTNWAAIAPAAFGGVLPEDVPNLKQLPILAVVGDRDELGMMQRVRDAVAVLKSGGAVPGYVEVAGGTHASAFDTALPQIFQFFQQHTR